MSAKSSIPPPAGLPGGNGKYIAVVLLLLLLVGGLVIWKLTRKPPTIALVVPPPSASVMVIHPEDDIPPPTIPDAGIDSGPKTPTTVVLSNGCDAKKCSGTTSIDLEAALAQRARQSHRCYDNALTADPTLKGKVNILVRVGANGSSCRADVSSNELANVGVSQCVVGFFRGGGFPMPKGGCVDATVPINFVPKQ